ncbi:hypothetical protein [Massilia sp. S19_KUP03_FR1]|uniref:hypothetical protein n=1 Tax=Massilia sp. S19_KUP03_FR1 TaxID=3025503 RepID=UPI002FCD8ABD
MTRSMLFRFIRLALSGSLIFGMSACASLGRDPARPLTHEGVRKVLTIGSSTKADVSKLMGEAKVNTFDSGYEVWAYDYKADVPMFVGFLPVVGTIASVVDASTRDRELAILFDKDGIVRKYQLREAPSQAERLLAPH